MRIIAFLGLLLVLISGCNNDPVSSRPQLKTVAMEAKAEEYIFPEKGIDAIGEKSGIQVTWHRSQEDIFFGSYILERTNIVDLADPDRPIEFEKIHETENIFDTVFVDTTNFDLYDMYFYRLALINVDGVRSDYSDTVKYKIYPKPVIEGVSKVIEDTLDLELTVDLGINHIEIVTIYVHVYNESRTERIFVAKPFKRYGSNRQRFRFLEEDDATGANALYRDFITGYDIFLAPDNSTPFPAQTVGLQPNTRYWIRVDYDGDERLSSGAESQYFQFFYN
jgi:hypothetical protein